PSVAPRDLHPFPTRRSSDLAATAAWLTARMNGTRGRADTVGLIALVSAQLLQTLALGRRDRMVVLASVSSLAALGVVVSVPGLRDRKSTRLNSSHVKISYAV